MSVRGRGGRRRTAAPKCSYRDVSSSDDELNDNNDIFQFLMAAWQQRGKTPKKRNTTKSARKRSSPRQQDASGSAKKRRKTKGTKSNSKTAASTSHPVNILSDDEDVKCAEITNAQADIIKDKVDKFFKAVESSDDEDDLSLKLSSEKKEPPEKKEKEFYEILSDSDDEVLKPNINATVNNITINITKPSYQPDTKTNQKNNSEDLLAIVDDIIKDDDINISIEEQEKNNIETLEDYRKKTDEMLNKVSSLINDLKKEEPKPETGKSCPICLENINAEKPAMATFCGHIFCQECITQVAKSTNKKCPTCRKTISLKKIHPVYL